MIGCLSYALGDFHACKLSVTLVYCCARWLSVTLVICQEAELRAGLLWVGVRCTELLALHDKCAAVNSSAMHLDGVFR